MVEQGVVAVTLIHLLRASRRKVVLGPRVLNSFAVRQANTLGVLQRIPVLTVVLVTEDMHLRNEDFDVFRPIQSFRKHLRDPFLEVWFVLTADVVSQQDV